ncbi:hypothetical protein, partial [Mesorhizobium sp.]|uniref:hypothetical protein n=1 Tax=Mesorhizobium sp. TaxID=1871066 RepID=UPI0025D12EE4
RGAGRAGRPRRLAEELTAPDRRGRAPPLRCVDLRYIGFAMNDPTRRLMIAYETEIGLFHALPVT